MRISRPQRDLLVAVSRSNTMGEGQAWWAGYCDATVDALTRRGLLSFYDGFWLTPKGLTALGHGKRSQLRTALASRSPARWARVLRVPARMVRRWKRGKAEPSALQQRAVFALAIFRGSA